MATDNPDKCHRQWLFAECQSKDCRFRFPVEAEHRDDLQCPRCRGRLFFVDAAAHSSAKSNQLPTAAGYLGALLDNIRSIHNVGSMFRTADGAGLDHLFLCGITATPEQPRLAKAALGSQASLAWSYHTNAVDLADDLVAQGYELWALERTDDTDAKMTIPAAIPVTKQVVLVIGNEKAGVDPDVLKRCERTIALPMTGIKNSLNAAVAFGIAAYTLRFGATSQLDMSTNYN